MINNLTAFNYKFRRHFYKVDLKSDISRIFVTYIKTIDQKTSDEIWDAIEGEQVEEVYNYNDIKFDYE